MRGAVGVLVCLWLAASAQSAYAQTRRVPPLPYFLATDAYNAGALRDAGAGFAKELRGAFKTSESRWIDSICCYAMIAETAYQVGDLRDAIEANTSALQLANKFPTWIRQCRLPESIGPMKPGAIRTCPWGVTARGTAPGDFPDVFMIAQGAVDGGGAFTTGGVAKPPSFFPVVGSEILRTTGLSLRRRRELLGPTAGRDAMLAEVIATWNKQLGSGKWWEVWTKIQLGLAYAAQGNNALAAPLLIDGATIGGQLDHPLTAMALFELGRMEMSRGAYDPAAAYFLEASITAFHFVDVGLIEESLRYGSLAHRLANHTTLYPPLAPAAEWAKKEKLSKLSTSLLLLQAETALFNQNDQLAASLLADAQVVARRTDLAGSRIGASAQRVAAQLAFRAGDSKSGEAAIGAALKFMETASLWRLHVGLVDGLTTSNTITPREALFLYAAVLRDPSPLDWLSDPLESLSYLAASDDAVRERWFDAAMLRKMPEDALLIADSVRRERFFNTLPLGGRLTSLRWTLHHPAPSPPAFVDRERLELLGKLPGYEQATNRINALKNKIAALGPNVPDGHEVRLRDELLASWATNVAGREALLQSAAVDRAACTMSWPPLRAVKELHEKLAPRQAILAFFMTRQTTHAFLIERARFSTWVVGATNDVHTQVANFLADVGCTHATRSIDEAAWKSQAWRRSSRTLFKSLMSGVGRTDWLSEVDELVVVPDGALWYLPFEALDMTASGGSSDGAAMSEQLDVLGTRLLVRYAPTVGLAVADAAAGPTNGPTVVLTGKLFPKDDERLAETAAAQLQVWDPQTQALTPHQRPTSPATVNNWGRMLALDELTPPVNGPYDWSFLGAPGDAAGLKLNTWLSLPPDAPRQMMLPGFRTAAERGLRDAAPALAGMDLFLPTMALQASGVRTLVISRWRTGGQTTVDLMKEFTQELPNTSPVDAWQRAVHLTLDTVVDLEHEPRLDWKEGLPPRANHPFLWSGYMLIDPGSPAPLTTAGR